MDSNTVVVIMRHTPESYDGRSAFCAVAHDVFAAKQWIQDEVDGKHPSGHTYAFGKSADWWIQYGTFSLETVTVH